ncbi:MAG: CHAT domain-containing tetratricopeptide repeat protein [Planctomycetota bacterium]|nr:CHAT domain-containing tetratricopeptide repeat protein [Planctomycetota bacterium]
MLRRLTPLLLMLLAAFQPAWAGEEDGTPMRAAGGADKVLQALQTGDTAALKRLAALDAPDPWRVADVLIGRGEHDAAKAFADAAEGKDTELLAAYVAGRRGKPDDVASRRAHDAWARALDRQDEAGFRGALQGIQPDLSTVIGVYVASLQVLERRGQVPEDKLSELASATADAALALGWRYHAARVLFANAYRAYRQGDYATAATQYRKVLAIHEQRDDPHNLALVSHNLGNVLGALGAYVEAEACYRRALKLREKLGDAAGVAAGLIDLAALFRRLGDKPQAHAYYERGIAQARKAGQETWLANALEGYGHVLSDEDNPKRARELHSEALAIRERLGDALHIASSVHNLGIVETELGNYEKAQEYLQRALQMRMELQHLPHMTQSLVALAQLRREQERLDEAADLYRQILKLYLEGGEPLMAAYARCALGEVLLEQEASDEVVSVLAQTAAEARRFRDPGLAARAHALLARAYLRRSDIAKALEQVREGQRVGRRGLSDSAAVFEVGIAAAVAAEDAGAALSFLEAGRAQALLQHITARDALLAAVVPEALREEEAAARKSLAAAARAASRGHRRRSEAREYWRAMRHAQARLRSILIRIQSEAQRAVQAQPPASSSLEDLQASLRKDQAFVLYGRHRDSLHALVVTKVGATVHAVGTLSALEPHLAVLDKDTDVDVLQLAAAAIRTQLVKPLGLPDTVRQVLVSPADALWRAPLGFVFKQTVAVLPSATAYVTLRRQKRERGEGVLAVGDPDTGHRMLARSLPSLPGARAEAREVGDSVLLGAEATRANLLERLASRGRWRALHLACHVVLDAKRPALSGLVLTPTQDDDGLWTTLDLLRIDLPAELVVLSADRGARGNVRRGEGSLALPRSFLLAGARQVVASVWRVDDAATKALMKKFYELWGGGLGVAEALRQAQTHVRAQERWAHPRYWAGWLVYGLPD